MIYTPVLDKQQDIYEDIFSLLDEAIANLDKTSVYTPLGIQDMIYGGDTESWKKFAYGLKARYTMRLSHKTPAYNDVISFAGQSFASADEQAQFNYNGNTAQSSMLFQDRDIIRSPADLTTAYGKERSR